MRRLQGDIQHVEESELTNAAAGDAQHCVQQNQGSRWPGLRDRATECAPFHKGRSQCGNGVSSCCSMQACRTVTGWHVNCGLSMVGIPLQSTPPHPSGHSQTAQFVCSVVFSARRYPPFMQRGSSLSILFLHTADRRRGSAP